MAKKSGFLDGLLDALGEGGAEILGELLGGSTGKEKESSPLGSAFEGEGGLVQGLGDLVSDLTGLGTSNPKASSVAKQKGVTKSSSAKKKSVNPSSGNAKAPKKAAAARKPAPAASTAKRKSSSSKKKTV